MRNRRFHNNTNNSSRPGRVPTVLRQQWSIILLFGMAFSLAFYTILTAPTVEQELIAHRRRGTDRRYRQREYGRSGSSSDSDSDSGGGQQQQQEQERSQQEEGIMSTAAMAAPGATTFATDWQSVDGRPILRIIPASALGADSPVVLLSPLPPQVTSSSIHSNGDTLTNIVMDNETDSNSLASNTTTSRLSLIAAADDESPSRFRQGAGTLTTTARSAQQNSNYSSAHTRHHVPTWEADQQEDGLV
jgi:hypothetical protein